MSQKVIVGGRIESKEVGGIVTGAAEILDDAKGKKQSVINGETDDELLRLDQSKQDNLTFDNAPTEGSNNPVKSGGVYAADKALSDAIEAILLLIPSAASGLNKLVDTDMMNSSISTATATFKGTYNVVTDLSLTIDATHEQIAAALGNVISSADNNDYAFVQVPVSAESTDIRRTERYKFNGTAWGYEYDLNTSGFTAAQWAAINSGITLALVGKLIGLPTSSELQALLGQKQDTLAFDNIPVSGSANPVKSGGVYSAINDEKTAREQLAQTVTGIDGRVEAVEEVIPTGAAANNKLVANNSMEAYVTSIIDAITASFTIATADGHINLTLTQTNGQIASLTLTSSDIASAQALTALTGRVSTNESDIANLQQLYNNLQQSKPEPVTALPETGQQQGVIYRLAGTTSYSDYMWNGSTWVLMATYNNAIDDEPTAGSDNLVKSGGVYDITNEIIGKIEGNDPNKVDNVTIKSGVSDDTLIFFQYPKHHLNKVTKIRFLAKTGAVSFYKINISDPSSVVYEKIKDITVASSDNNKVVEFETEQTLGEKEYIGICGNFWFSANQSVVNGYTGEAYNINTGTLSGVVSQIYYYVDLGESIDGEIENLNNEINIIEPKLDDCLNFKAEGLPFDETNLLRLSLGLSNTVRESNVYFPDNRAKYKFVFSVGVGSTAGFAFVESNVSNNQCGSYFSIDDENLYVHLAINSSSFQDTAVKYTFPLGWKISDYHSEWIVFEIERDCEYFTLKVFTESLSRTFVTRVKSQPMKTVDAQQGINDIDLGLMHGSVSLIGTFPITEAVVFYESIAPRIAILGDSVSEGFGCVEKGCRYADLLQKRFGNVVNFAVGGAQATQYGLPMISTISSILSPDYILIYLGTNYDADMEQSLASIISTALNTATKGVVLCTIPTNTTISAWMRTNYSNVQGVHLVDVMNALAPAGVKIPEFFDNVDMQGNPYSDVHPNAKGQIEIYKTIIKSFEFL